MRSNLDASISNLAIQPIWSCINHYVYMQPIFRLW